MRSTNACQMSNAKRLRRIQRRKPKELRRVNLRMIGVLAYVSGGCCRLVFCGCVGGDPEFATASCTASRVARVAVTNSATYTTQGSTQTMVSSR